VLGYAFRDQLAAKVAGVALERSSKLHCTKPRIHLGRALDLIEVGAIQCTMAEGPLRYARTHGAAGEGSRAHDVACRQARGRAAPLQQDVRWRLGSLPSAECASAGARAMGLGTRARLGVKPDKGQLSANVYLTKPEANSKPDISVTVEGRHLTEQRPRIEVEL
jgi:hypothetical protein